VGGPAYIFGLPGNPVSAFCLHGAVALDYWPGLAAASLRSENEWPCCARRWGPNGPREILPCRRNWMRRRVTPLPWKGSADIYTVAAADAAYRGEGEPELAGGGAGAA